MHILLALIFENVSSVWWGGWSVAFKKTLSFGKFTYGSDTKSCPVQSLLVRSSVCNREFGWENVQSERPSFTLVHATDASNEEDMVTLLATGGVGRDRSVC